jgi:hypothetical protein
VHFCLEEFFIIVQMPHDEAAPGREIILLMRTCAGTVDAAAEGWQVMLERERAAWNWSKDGGTADNEIDARLYKALTSVQTLRDSIKYDADETPFRGGRVQVKPCADEAFVAILNRFTEPSDVECLEQLKSDCVVVACDA